MNEHLTDLCKKLEAFETAHWAIESILDVELLTSVVTDPCAGRGLMGMYLRRAGYTALSYDIHDWGQTLGTQAILDTPIYVTDFFSRNDDLEGQSVLMNPPFSKACEFVDHARNRNARKIVCFQRQAWRESESRGQWWEDNPPARVWVCGARATCWRFDLMDCHHAGSRENCPNIKRRAKKHESPGCMHCMGGAPTSHAWYVWERGHRGAEITRAIYPRVAP